MAENEGTGEGTSTGTGTGEGAAPPAAWTAQLPTELQGNTAITSFKTIGELGKSFLETSGKIKEYETKGQEYEGKVKEFETKIASDYIPKLKENATPEEKSAYFKAIGRPDTGEGYKLPQLDIPAELAKQIDPTGEAAFRSDCLAAGLNNEQAGFIYKQFMERNIQRFNQAQAVVEQNRQDSTLALKAEWKEKFDVNAEITNRAMAKYMSPELKASLEAAGLGNNVELAKMFLTLGTNTILNDTLIRGDQQRGAHEAREPGKLNYPSMAA